MTATRSIVVVGGGEHAGVVIDAIRSQPDAWSLLGFVDPRPCDALARRFSLTRLGDDSDGSRLAGAADLVLGVGSIGVSSRRAQVVAAYGSAGWAVVVHARAWVAPTAQLGAGTVVMAGAVVNAGAVVGAHCVVNTGAIVEHDCALGDFSQLGPAAVIGGGVTVGAGSYLGLGCRVRDHVTIGAGATIAMGAVVTTSVPDGAVVMGVPARERHGA